MLSGLRVAGNKKHRRIKLPDSSGANRDGKVPWGVKNRIQPTEVLEIPAKRTFTLAAQAADSQPASNPLYRKSEGEHVTKRVDGLVE
jgi:hypothetical protein